MKGKRKTITAQDVLSALEDMEFDQFVDPLKECLAGRYMYIEACGITRSFVKKMDGGGWVTCGGGGGNAVKMLKNKLL